MRVALAVAALLVAFPLAAAVGPWTQGVGEGTYAYTSASFACSATGTFAFTYDATGATFSGVPGLDCFPFAPDNYAPDECARDAGGNVTCAYAFGGVSSSLFVAPDGAFDYAFVFEDGSTDAVTGTLRFL